MASWVQAALQILNGVRAEPQTMRDQAERGECTKRTCVAASQHVDNWPHHQPLCCELKRNKIGKDWDFPGVQWLGFHLSVEGEMV